ncbi:hypothetical protein RRG08_055236 [Elysia crispata]|uniref:Uncharacterized protein n=1 Tax=Elysia crispata TaxID=231223 RepID=A0AAE0XUK2_9GAST|nr:hypothetical protein RRG08_055236 [Elysia crispata]
MEVVIETAFRHHLWTRPGLSTLTRQGETTRHTTRLLLFSALDLLSPMDSTRMGTILRGVFTPPGSPLRPLLPPLAGHRNRCYFPCSPIKSD